MIPSAVRTRSRLLLPAILLASACAGAGGKDEVQSFPDGSPKARFHVDEQGRRDGDYTDFHPNGKPRVKASFHAGLLEGAFHSFTAEGAAVASALYRRGQLDGTCTLYRDGKPSPPQVWKEGVLQRYDDVPTHPRPLGPLAVALTKIQGVRVGAVPTKEEERARALRRLQAYRHLCEVPYDGLVLDPECNRKCDAAADICLRIGKLDHTPINPKMPEAEYQLAYDGTTHSNLATTSDMVLSVDGYMDDSDASNIDHLGHRRWCLNPKMLKTGFGSAREFSAMWSHDQGRSRVPGYEVVAYPPKGWVPVSMFSARHAWSLLPDPARYPKLGKDIQVKVFALDEHYQPAAEPMEMDFFKIAPPEGVLGPCVIFRPAGVEVAPGKRYWVEVTGLLKSGAGLRYLVEFVDLAKPPQAAAPALDGYLLPLYPAPSFLPAP